MYYKYIYYETVMLGITFLVPNNLRIGSIT